MASFSGGHGPELSRGDSHKSEQSSHHRYAHFIDDSEVFLTKLREFKPQSLGCLEARRKSSSTLIFPNPQQACVGPSKCPRYPHDIKPTPSYWIECHGPGMHHGKTTCAQDHNQSSAFKSDDFGLHREGSLKEHFSRQRSDAGQQYRFNPSDFNDIKLRVDCSGRSRIAQIPTTPTAERILTRHDKDILSDQDEIDAKLRQNIVKEGQSTENVDAVDGGAAYGEQQSCPTDLGQQDSNKGMGASAGVVSPDHAKQLITLKAEVASTTKNTSDIKKRLNKRTMTRDDIDLHKSRRGTPNITITEPSFNQSTAAYLHFRQYRATRQDSQSEEGPPEEKQASFTTKIQIQSCATVESPTDEAEKNEDVFLNQQESSDSDDYRNLAQEQIGALDFKPYRQHRPSVIREDSDVEDGEEDNENQERRQFYCGFSTTSFHKAPYHIAVQKYKHIRELKDKGLPVPDETSQYIGTGLELISFEEENFEKHYYGKDHWNYFTNDELLGPVMLSLKQEVNNQRDHFHVLLRTVSYTLHGMVPATNICADRYDRAAVVRELSEIAKLKPPLILSQLITVADDLLKLDQIFIKTELKVGVIYIKAGQLESEEAILANKEESPLFTEFLDLLGDRVTLKGFDRYKGGLDTVHNLTGTESVYTMWRNIEIMFHVSTMLPHEENDPQKLQKKRHIGNDIVCVAFIESDDALFWPGCIKSYFLHTFITVRTSPKAPKEGEKRKYHVSCVCRNEVQNAFKPFLSEQDEFHKSDYFREWLLVKIVNGERASYSAPKFARMQDRTRSQLLEDIVTNLTNHHVTGQIPKAFRRGSWRPLGHNRAQSPLEDCVRDYFEDYDQLAKDFCNAFCGPSRSMLCDVAFRVKDKDGNWKLVYGVRAILAIRSKTFFEMLYGCPPPIPLGPDLSKQGNLREIEMKALSGESSAASSSGGKEVEHTKSLLAKRGSVGADTARKMGEKERRQSMLPNLSKSIGQKPNYLTVPNTSGSGIAGSGGGGSGTGAMIKNAFNRLVSGNWSGWSGNVKGFKDPMLIKVDQNKTKVDLTSLAICKEVANIDPEKLAQREFEIKIFDYETFQQIIEYVHNGQCKLSYDTIPKLICAAEYYDLPDLLHACFHHANTHMKLGAATKMMNDLQPNTCFFPTAMQLVESIYDFIDPQGDEFFSRSEYIDLDESLITNLLKRPTLQISEIRKFQVIDKWARHQAIKNVIEKRRKLQRQQSSEQEKFDLEVNIEPNHDEETEVQYKLLLERVARESLIKLDRIANEDLVKIVLPTKVFSNDAIFNIMADESRIDS